MVFPTKYIKKIDALNAESNRNVSQVTLEATKQDNKKLSTLLNNGDLIEKEHMNSLVTNN